MSGYGMEYIGVIVLLRLFRLHSCFFVALFFSCFFIGFCFRVISLSFIPGFLVLYFVLMVLYRFIRNIYGLVAAFCVLALFFAGFGFEFGWSASFGAFSFRCFFCQESTFVYFEKMFFCFLPGVFLLFLGCECALWCVFLCLPGPSFFLLLSI